MDMYETFLLRFTHFLLLTIKWIDNKGIKGHYYMVIIKAVGNSACLFAPLL